MQIGTCHSSSNSLTRRLSQQAVKFPLPLGYFPQITLLPEQIVKYEHEVQEAIRKALGEYSHYNSMGAKATYPVSKWTAVSTFNELTAIQNSNNTSAYMKSRIFGQVDSDYRQFLDLVHTESSKELLDWNQLQYGYAVDSAVLCNIHTKKTSGEKKPTYMGLKWVCLQPSTMHRKRDMCYLEYATYMLDLNGQEVAIRVQLPVELPECPEFERSMKVKRIPVQTVTIVTASTTPRCGTDPKAHVFMLIESVSKDFFSSTRYLKKEMQTLHDMFLLGDLKRIWEKGMVSRSNWVPTRSRKCCSICDSTFHAMRRRHHCRLCGDLICRKCIVLRDAPKQKQNGRKAVKVVKTKFCLLCVGKIRDTPVQSLGVPILGESREISSCVRSNNRTTKSRTDSFDDNSSAMSFISMWSETESESEKLSLSSLSELKEDGDSTTSSFVVISTSSETSKPRKDLPMVLEALEEPVLLDVSETIDTSDMLRVNNPLLTNDNYEFGPPVFFTTTKPTNRATTGSINSDPAPRSIDQCLQEQEELLRRMVFESSRVRAKTAPSTFVAPTATTSSVQFDATMKIEDLAATRRVSAASKEQKVKVTLYEP